MGLKGASRFLSEPIGSPPPVRSSRASGALTGAPQEWNDMSLRLVIGVTRRYPEHPKTGKALEGNVVTLTPYGRCPPEPYRLVQRAPPRTRTFSNLSLSTHSNCTTIEHFLTNARVTEWRLGRTICKSNPAVDRIKSYLIRAKRFFAWQQ
jgi:hypothetical protein